LSDFDSPIIHQCAYYYVKPGQNDNAVT